MLTRKLFGLVLVLAFSAAPARADDYLKQILTNPLHPANPMYQQNVKNMEEGFKAWAEMGPSKPTFATRVGSGVVANAVVNAAGALLDGDLSWNYFGTQKFWGPVVGSSVGAALGALVPGGTLVRAGASIAGAGLGAAAGSPKDQDWTMNIATTAGAALLGAMMSPLPGGTFVGALTGHLLAAGCVTLYREFWGNRYPELSPPVLGRAMSLLGVKAGE